MEVVTGWRWITETKQARDSWKSKIGVILAAAGSAVGIGNFLRFPGVAAQNGGGAFMIPYFVSFVLIALPLCWVEWTMGRYGGIFGRGTSPAVFDRLGGGKRKWLKYLGVLGVSGSLGIDFYYIYVESWTLGYTAFSLTGKYAGMKSPDQVGAFLSSFLSGSGEYFHSIWPLYICFLVTFFCNFWVLYHGVSKGIERFCKITMPLLFILAVILVIRVFTLGAPYRPEWSVNGALGFLWNPDFSILKNGKVWLAAAGQVFFSTSVGIGVLMTYATYLKPKDDILLPATSACFLNEMAEVVLGASIVIPAAFLFFGPADTQTAIAGGTFGLAFRTTPLIFNSMPWGGLFGFLWFLLLFIACVTSSVSILQPGIAFLEEEFHFSRKRCVLCIGALVFAVAHLAIFGDGVVDVMDFWFSEFGLPMFGLIEALVFVFIFGKTRGWEEMTRNSAIRLPRFFRPIVFGVMPLFLATILITWLVSDGWQKVLMLKRGADGHLVSLYTPSQLPWVIATTLVVLATTAGFCWLIRLAWKSPQHRE
ncbi:MAG: sodium-dependent transporter [Kiritimatiellae bacterium]|nr:sodium-dependent transporter [Kiritimatiellia bacterium]